ncbi:alanine aminotransferase 2-like isoform X2 [Protopterus annectens]|uniref:alanine aminotransferase 2-like isoform X2 n=1 Tax=Protopterus annectens TaxID=7888 RepID=UPI001CFAE76C|nr:alanine aminotransferase 2-like isoform X2 [Protopterus annectens]
MSQCIMKTFQTVKSASVKFCLYRNSISLVLWKKHICDSCEWDIKYVQTAKVSTVVQRSAAAYRKNANNYWKSVKSAKRSLHGNHPLASQLDPWPGPMDGYKEDAQALGQHPFTFSRQVVAICVYPELIHHPALPEDAKERARRILQHCNGGSVGSYSDSKGNSYIRSSVAKYIEQRDGGISSNPDKVYVMGGATEIISNVLKVFTSDRGTDQAGALVPVPHYPMYSHVAALNNMVRVDYYLHEDSRWSLQVEELRTALYKSRKYCKPKLLCIINPGNPTGQILSPQCIEDAIRFAEEEHLAILADEVFQSAVHKPNCEFYSVKKVLHGMGPKYYNNIELISVNSISKSYMAETGMRGGYMELLNIDPNAEECWYEMLSAHSCATLAAQITLDVISDPPQPGDLSYDTFEQEKMTVLMAMSENAKLTEETLNTLTGIQCLPIEATNYAYPRIELPEKAVTCAKSQSIEPDVFYCKKLMSETGISLLMPGSLFGQKEGTYHYRLSTFTG